MNMHGTVKTVSLVIASLAVFVTSLRADFFSPFADSKVGSTVTSVGQIVAVERKGGGADYFVRCRTCTGIRDIPAEIPPKLLTGVVLNLAADITTAIKEREDDRSKSKERYLEVQKIEVMKK